jgi:hypothetical protein
LSTLTPDHVARDRTETKQMKNITGTHSRPGERGAVSIKTLFIFVFLSAAAFTLIKVAPVYISERQVTYQVDELANKSAVRNSKEEVIYKAIEALQREFDLPENSINLVSREQGKVQISLTYQKNIDLLVTTYQWKVAHTAAGKDL